MSEINRVFTHIDGFFEAGGSDHCMALANVIALCAAKAQRGYRDRDMEDQVLADRITATLVAAKELGSNPPETKDEMRRAFRELAIEAMTVRRSILPLRHPTKYGKKIDPGEALYDDDDQYAFAIYDTLADEIGELLPDLHKLAVEVAWNADQLD
jgi:hypothetical protein